MSEPHALYNVSGHVAVITLNRPKAKNAFSPEMISLWREYLEKAKIDDTIRVIIVTGKGDTFCSGGALRHGGRKTEIMEHEKVPLGWGPPDRFNP